MLDALGVKKEVLDWLDELREGKNLTLPAYLVTLGYLNPKEDLIPSFTKLPTRLRLDRLLVQFYKTFELERVESEDKLKSILLYIVVVFILQSKNLRASGVDTDTRFLPCMFLAPNKWAIKTKGFNLLTSEESSLFYLHSLFLQAIVTGKRYTKTELMDLFLIYQSLSDLKDGRYANLHKRVEEYYFILLGARKFPKGKAYASLTKFVPKDLENIPVGGLLNKFTL